MEAKLLAHSETGGFANKEELRSWLDTEKYGDGTYFLEKVYDLPSGCLVLFERDGCIVGCAIIREGARAITDDERRKSGGTWKAIMRLDPRTIWAWRPEQDVRLTEGGIRWRGPGPPYDLTSQNIIRIFRLVSERSR